MCLDCKEALRQACAKCGRTVKCAFPGDTEEAVLRRGGDMEAVLGSTLGGKEVHRHVPLGQEQMTSLSPRRAAIH